ncbi:MAG: MCE family protein [Bacteroidales bacterium]|nr:MCE family protein [Bacteroidales bacterium]
MPAKTKHRMILGMFVFLGIVIFSVTIYLIGTKQNLFTPNVKIFAVFTDVFGLTVGNNVRFCGIDVGTVSDIKILSEKNVKVELSIKTDAIPYIHKNSIATIGSEGLMGNKTIIIIPGTLEERSLQGGDTLLASQPVNIDEVLLELKTSTHNISVVSNNLIDITRRIRNGEGIFGMLFTDSELTGNIDRVSQNANMITKNLNDISARVKNGEGILGKLLADTVFSHELNKTSKNFIEISENLEGITDKINRGEGVFGKLFTDTSLTHNIYVTSQHLQTSTEDLQVVSRNLLEITEKINSGSGLINKLLTDSAFAGSVDTTFSRLNKGIVSATETSEAIKKSRMLRLFSKKNNK